MLEEKDYVARGERVIAPQRGSVGNLNTFHLFDHWEDDPEDGLAKRGDAAIQHPGIDINRKHELIAQTLKESSCLPPTPEKPFLLISTCLKQELFFFNPHQLEQMITDCLAAE